jgi:hypothetical protein
VALTSKGDRVTTSSSGAAAVVVVVVVVVVVAGAAGADVVWAWIVAQADIAATNTATSREFLGVYFIVWGVVWLLGKRPRFAWAGISDQATG